jgi:flagellar motor switch/type III secretory pathway protein FliN
VLGRAEPRRDRARHDDVDLRAERAVARGKIVTVDGCYGVRITDLD